MILPILTSSVDWRDWNIFLHFCT